MWSVIARCALVLAVIAACSGQPARVHLVNVNQTGCGQPDAATHVNVISYSPTRGETTIAAFQTTDPVASITDFPPDTEEIGVRVTGAGGAVLAIGKTAPLPFASLPDGANVPVFMAPPDGFCKTGDLDQVRVHPVVAPAGAGALVVGGDDGSGAPLSSIEYYDPATATFSPVDVSVELVDPSSGLHGAVLTPLADGRVAFTGTGNHVIAFFDPARPTGLTPSPPTSFDHRAFHGAIAPDAEHLFVIGGCLDVALGACSGLNLHSSFDYELGDLAKRASGPSLGSTAQRVDATLFDIGVQDDGVHRYVLAGGSGDFGVGDRFALDDAQTTALAGLHAQVAAADGGAIVSAFAADTDAPGGAAGVLPPGGSTLAAIANAPARSGARLVALEDGTTVSLGGDATPSLYDPTADAWTALPPNAPDAPGAIAGPSVARLADGSVLVLDGTASAWIFRPSLVGPQSGQIGALPLGTGAGVLVSPDPSTVTRSSGDLVLTAKDASLDARVLVGGPRMTTGNVAASVRVTAGGVALIAQQVGPGRALVAELVPGMPVRIERIDGGSPNVLATGPVVEAFDPAGAQVSFDIHAQTATVTVNGAVTSADLAADPDAGDRGSWGIAADGLGAKVELTTITVSR